VLFIRSRIAIADAGATSSAVAPVFAMRVSETESTYHYCFLKPKRSARTPHKKSFHAEQLIRHHENHDATITSAISVIEASDKHPTVGQRISAPLDGIGQASSIFAVILLTFHSDHRSILPPVTGVIAHSPEFPLPLAPGDIRVQRAVRPSKPSIAWRKTGPRLEGTGRSWVLARMTRSCRALQISVRRRLKERICSQQTTSTKQSAMKSSRAN